MAGLPVFLEIISVIFLGLALGSFATALSWRVPRGESWLGIKEGGLEGSACPKCKKQIKKQHLIPVISWFLLGGRCHACEEPIGYQYLLIELLTTFGCLGVYFVWGFTVPALIIMAVIPLLAALFFIDLEHMILPNQLILLSAALAFILLIYQLIAYGFDYGFGQQVTYKIFGALGFAIMIWLSGYLVGIVLKKEALGMGDVKFFAMAGLWLGITYLPFFLVFSGACGVFLGLIYRIFLKKQLFPFGPALILSLYTCLLLQGLEIVPLIGVQ